MRASFPRHLVLALIALCLVALSLATSGPAIAKKPAVRQSTVRQQQSHRPFANQKAFGRWRQFLRLNGRAYVEGWGRRERVKIVSKFGIAILGKLENAHKVPQLKKLLTQLEHKIDRLTDKQVAAEHAFLRQMFGKERGNELVDLLKKADKADAAGDALRSEIKRYEKTLDGLEPAARAGIETRIADLSRRLDDAKTAEANAKADYASLLATHIKTKQGELDTQRSEGYEPSRDDRKNGITSREWDGSRHFPRQLVDSDGNATRDWKVVRKVLIGNRFGRYFKRSARNFEGARHEVVAEIKLAEKIAAEQSKPLEQQDAVKIQEWQLKQQEHREILLFSLGAWAENLELGTKRNIRRSVSTKLRRKFNIRDNMNIGGENRPVDLPSREEAGDTPDWKLDPTDSRLWRSPGDPRKITRQRIWRGKKGAKKMKNTELPEMPAPGSEADTVVFAGARKHMTFGPDGATPSARGVMNGHEVKAKAIGEDNGSVAAIGSAVAAMQGHHATFSWFRPTQRMDNYTYFNMLKDANQQPFLINEDGVIRKVAELAGKEGPRPGRYAIGKTLDRLTNVASIELANGDVVTGKPAQAMLLEAIGKVEKVGKLEVTLSHKGNPERAVEITHVTARNIELQYKGKDVSGDNKSAGPVKMAEYKDTRGWRFKAFWDATVMRGLDIRNNNNRKDQRFSKKGRIKGQRVVHSDMGYRLGNGDPTQFPWGLKFPKQNLLHTDEGAYVSSGMDRLDLDTAIWGTRRFRSYTPGQYFVHAFAENMDNVADAALLSMVMTARSDAFADHIGFRNYTTKDAYGRKIEFRDEAEWKEIFDRVPQFSTRDALDFLGLKEGRDFRELDDGRFTFNQGDRWTDPRKAGTFPKTPVPQYAPAIPGLGQKVRGMASKVPLVGGLLKSKRAAAE